MMTLLRYDNWHCNTLTRFEFVLHWQLAIGETLIPSVDVLEQMRIQAAMGMMGGFVEPDLDFVKHVKLGVIMVKAKIPGGRSCYMFFMYEHNYHLKAILERLVEIDGLGEYFAVPCKYITRKVGECNILLISSH